MTTFEHFTTQRNYTKCVDMELMVDLHGHSYLVGFEVSLKLWEDNHDVPSLDCLSEVEAWDSGSHQVTDNATLDQLRAIVAQRLDDEGYESVVEAIEKKERE